MPAGIVQLRPRVLGGAPLIISPLQISPGPILYLNSTLGLSGAHNDPISLWPDQSGGARDASQPTGGKQPALQTTSNLSPSGRQMVLFGGVSPNNDQMAFAADLPARTEVTILVYGRMDLTGIGVLTQCYPVYGAVTGDRPDLKTRSHSECTVGGIDNGSAYWADTTGEAQWSEFLAESGVHRLWVWRFSPPEGATGIVTMFRGSAAGLVKGSNKVGWGWSEVTADGYVISRTDGNAGYRGTLGVVLRYHTALSDLTILKLYNWLKINFGFD